MPNRYTVEDDNGNRLVLEGDSPPTEQELEQVFSQIGSPKIAPPPSPASSALRRYVADPAISLAKGVIGLPEAAVGLADIPTLGRAGKLLEAGGYGFQPKVAKDYLSTLYSPEQRAAQEKVRKAKGFAATIKAMIENPSTIAETVIESAPSMAGGAGVARKVLTSVPKIGALVAGAVGEGAISAGQSAEQTRQESPTGTLTPKQAALSLTSGAATGLIGVLGGGLARRLGVADIDTLMAGGVSEASKRNILRRAVESAIVEGAFEELPQSAQEQWQQNLANGRPAGEGVAEAAANGLLAGLVMGGAGGAVAQPLSRANRGARAAIARGPRREATTQTSTEKANAIFQRSPAPLPVSETPTPRPQVVEEIRQPQEPTLPQPGTAEAVETNPNLAEDLALLGSVIGELRGQIGVPTQQDLISVAKSPKPLTVVRDQIRRVLTEIERRQETMTEPWAYREQVEPVLRRRLAEIERQMMPPVERAALPENIGGTLGGASENLPAEAQAIEAANKAKQRQIAEGFKRANAAKVKPVELLTADEAEAEWRRLVEGGNDIIPRSWQTWQQGQMVRALQEKRPIAAPLGESLVRGIYGEGYVREGDQYVFKPSENAPQGAPLAASGETTPVGVEQTPAAAGGTALVEVERQKKEKPPEISPDHAQLLEQTNTELAAAKEVESESFNRFQALKEKRTKARSKGRYDEVDRLDKRIDKAEKEWLSLSDKTSDVQRKVSELEDRTNWSKAEPFNQQIYSEIQAWRAMPKGKEADAAKQAILNKIDNEWLRQTRELIGDKAGAAVNGLSTLNMSVLARPLERSNQISNLAKVAARTYEQRNAKSSAEKEIDEMGLHWQDKPKINDFDTVQEIQTKLEKARKVYKENNAAKAKEEQRQQAEAEQSAIEERQRALDLQKSGKLVWRRIGNKQSDRWEPVSGKPVKIPEVSGYKLNIFKSGDQWVVVEDTTGLKLGGGGTQAAAIAEVKSQVERIGLKRFADLVEKARKETPPRPNLNPPPEGGQPARPTEPKEPTTPTGGAEPAANLGTGLAEGRGMSPDQARAAIAGEPTAGFTVEIISKDRAEEITGRPEARGYGGFFWQGKIYLVHENMAAGDVAGAKALLREEVGHGLLRTKEGTRRLQEVLDEGRLQLTEAEKQTLRDQGYLENQLLDEFIAKSARENRSWWASAVEKIRVWLSSVGLANLTNAEVARLLLGEIARTRQADIGNLPGERLVTRNAIIIAPGITPPAAITAYHGTPHKVDRFSTEKIGTGEGAQVYGWGLYFAENPEVGQAYKRSLSGRFEEWNFSTLNAAASKLSEILGQSVDPSDITLGPDGTQPAIYNGGQGSVTVGKSPISPYRDRYTVQFQPLGNDYTVTLNAAQDELLDWDAPLSQQSEKVKAAIGSILPLQSEDGRYKENRNGNELYAAITTALTKPLPPEEKGWTSIRNVLLRADDTVVGSERAASEYLASLGIKGIRYLDQGSRGMIDVEVRQNSDGTWFVTQGISVKRNGLSRQEATDYAAELALSSPVTFNYVIFNDADISITHENGQPVSLREAMGTSPLLPDLAPGQPTGEKERPRHRVMGLPMGTEYDPQPYAQSRRFILRRYFGVTGEITDKTELPVTPENTAYARKLVDQLSDPAAKGRLTKELKDQVEAAGGEMDAATQALQNELQDYATNSGDRELGWNLARNWGEFASELSAAGRELQAVKMSRSYQLYKEVHDFMVRAGDAAAKLVGKDLFDAVNGLIGRVPKTDKVAKEVATKVETKVGAKKLKSSRTAKETVEDPQTDIDELTNEEIAEVDPNELTAKSILDPMEERPTEWLKPDAKKDIIREIVKAALKGNNPAEIAAAVGEFGANIAKADLKPTEPIYQDPTPFTTPLAALLESQGVTPDTAARLALEIHKQRLDKWSVARERAVARASRRGTLSALVEEIRQTPYLLQRSPEWLRTTSENWFMSHGLSRDQAVEAAKEFVPEFMEALTIAVEREATAVLKDRRLAQGTIDLIVRSIRSGLFDPAKTWYSDALAERGFKNITEADFKLLAELDKKMADPDRSRVEVSETIDAVLAVWRRLGTPPAIVDSMSANMLASFLTGFRTVGVNYFAPLIYDLTEVALTATTSPRSVGFMAKEWALGFKPWWNAVRTSMGRDAYSFLDGEWYAAQNQLKALWERGRRQMGIPDGWTWRQGLPKLEPRTAEDRSRGLANLVYGSQQFLMRILSALDNANGMKRRDMMTVLYTSQEMRRLGFSTQEIRAVVDMVYALREHFYQQSIESGRPKALAVVRANDLARQSFIDYLKGDLSPELREAVAASETLNDARWTPDVVKQIAEASALEGHSVVGRLGEGIQESSEGGVVSRVVMNNLIELGNWMTRKAGLTPAIRVQMFGYMNVPWRTYRFYGWLGPTGLLRGGHDAFRTKILKKDSWWQQSMANEVQSRQRWKMIIASNVVFAGLIALGFKKSTDADDEDDTGVYFTGAGPKNKQLKSAWIANKFKPYSMVVSINGNKMAVDMTRSFEPLAHMTWMLAAQDDAAWRKKEAEAKGKPYEPTVSDETAAAAGTYLGIMSQRGFMQTIAQAGEVASGRQDPRMFLAQKGSSFAAGLVTPYLGLQQSIAGMMAGPVDRSSIQSAIAANVPALQVFGDTFRKPVVNRFGDPLYNPEKSWYHRMYYTGIPIAFSVADSPTNKALYGLLVEKGVAPPEIRRSTLEQRYRKLSDDEYQKFFATTGPLLKGDVVRNIPTLKNMTPEGVKSFLDRSAETANRITAMGMGLESRTPPRVSAAPAISLPAAPRAIRAIPVSVGVGRARAAISRIPSVRRGRFRSAIRLTRRRPRLRSTVSRARRAIGTRLARVRRSARGVIARIRRPRFGLSFA